MRAQLQRRLSEEGIEPLWETLREIDPAAAARLHSADEKRILRALEVYYETGRTITAHNEETAALPKKYDAVYIGLRFREREDMRALIDRRVEHMVADGLLQEVEALLSAGLPPASTALQAIGYKEFAACRRGEVTQEEAIELVKLRSRQYAKRQLTYLRRNGDIHWLDWEKERDFDKALQEVTEILSGLGLR